MASDVLVLSLDFPPNDGGISRLAASAVAALGALGNQCRVVTLVQHDRCGLERPSSPVIEVDRRRGLRDVQLFLQIRSHLRRFGQDAPILATLWNPEATIAMLAGAKRVTILAHGNEIMPYPKKGPKALLRRIVLERANVVVCNSCYTEGVVRQIAPKTKTVILNPAVEPDRFCVLVSQAEARTTLGLPALQRIILTVARLERGKGHETVLRAIAELSKKQRSELMYVIIGKGEMRSSLESMARELGIERHVQFAGFVPDADLPMWYKAADLFVLPSIVDQKRRGMEGFGMALTEAQAAGLPVIGSRSGGIPDAVRVGEGGWLIEERDAARLAHHLAHLLEKPADFVNQGFLGQQRVRREMSWSGYAHQLRGLL